MTCAPSIPFQPSGRVNVIRIESSSAPASVQPACNDSPTHRPPRPTNGWTVYAPAANGPSGIRAGEGLGDADGVALGVGDGVALGAGTPTPPRAGSRLIPTIATTTT